MFHQTDLAMLVEVEEFDFIHGMSAWQSND